VYHFGSVELQRGTHSASAPSSSHTVPALHHHHTQCQRSIIIMIRSGWHSEWLFQKILPIEITICGVGFAQERGGGPLRRSRERGWQQQPQGKGLAACCCASGCMITPGRSSLAFTDS